MKRMYYLTSNLDSTVRISNDIHTAGITDWHFHVISKDEAGLYRRHVHGASLLQKQDVIRYGERGAIAGFILALLATGYAMATEVFGSEVTGFIYVAMFGFITLFGAWLGGLIGLATENQAIAQFHGAIDRGDYLILIDVRRGQEDSIARLMAEKHPEARLMRIGSNIITPFQIPRSDPA